MEERLMACVKCRKGLAIRAGAQVDHCPLCGSRLVDMDFPVDKWKELPKEERDRVFDMLMDASDQGAGRKKDAAKRKNVKREFPKGVLFALLAILAVGVVFVTIHTIKNNRHLETGTEYECNESAAEVFCIIRENGKDGSPNFKPDDSHLLFITKDIKSLAMDNSIVLDSSNVIKAIVSSNNSDYLVEIELDDIGRERLKEATTEAYSKNKSIAIYYNGSIINAPKVQAVITDGKFLVHGFNEKNQADEMVKRISGEVVLTEVQSGAANSIEQIASAPIIEQDNNVEYSKDELLQKAGSLCDQEYIKEWVYEDIDGNGYSDLIVESGKSTEDSWIQYFVYTDGTNTYKFGEHECWLYGEGSTEVFTIPKQNGGLFFALTNSERPPALAAYMPYSAIYNPMAGGADKIYEQELCMLSDPDVGKITANYTYLLEGNQIATSSNLIISDDGTIKGNLILDEQMELYYEDSSGSNSEIVGIGDKIQHDMENQNWLGVITDIYNDKLAEWVSNCKNKRTNEYINWNTEVMILPTTDNEGVLLDCTFSNNQLETINVLTRDKVSFDGEDVYVGVHAFFNQDDGELHGGLTTYSENAIVQFRTVEHDVVHGVYYLIDGTLVYDEFY